MDTRPETWWVVTCKNSDCLTDILLDKIGNVDPSRMLMPVSIRKKTVVAYT